MARGYDAHLIDSKGGSDDNIGDSFSGDGSGDDVMLLVEMELITAKEV